MGDEEHLMCVTWNTHKDALISLFDNLLQQESLVDCTLAAEGQYIKAHKIIISACSPYLQKLLSEHSENHPIIILNETKFLDLKCILEYMYRGEVNMSKREIPSFMKTAEALQIRGLTNSKTREELLQESRRCSSGQRRKRRRQNRDSDVRAEDLDGRPSFGSSSLNDSLQTSDTNKERSTNGDNTTNNEAQQNETFETKQETILDVDLTREEAPLEISEPRPSTSSETSANHLNYTGYSSEPLAISNEEHDMDIEGYDSNIDNSEEKMMRDLESTEQLTLIVLPDTYTEGEIVQENAEEEEVIGDEILEETGDEEIDLMLKLGMSDQDEEQEEDPLLPKYLKRRGGGGELSTKSKVATSLESSFQCAACGLTFKHYRGLIAHESWECGKLPQFKCDLCGKEFHLEQYLRQHLTKHACKVKDEHACPKCDRKFKQQSNLESHLKFECGMEPSFPCTVCDAKFHFRAHLNEHLLTTHTQAMLSSERKVPREESDGVGNEKYQCELCPRQFTRVGSLNYHVSRKHSTGPGPQQERDPNLYPFKCQVCSNRYKNSTQLCRHRRWECGKEPLFQCTLCEKKFHHRHGLKQHIRLHLANVDKAKPSSEFYCDKCGKGYKLKSSLNNHTKWECGKEPLFNCTVCFVKFSHKGNLKKHILTKHIQ